MSDPQQLSFSQPDVLQRLAASTDALLDEVPFGVIAFDQGGHIRRYNRTEVELTGLKRERVIGRHVFTDIAQCMNNFLVAQKYEDALQVQQSLDTTLDFVLTWRMRPTPVQLRLLYAVDTPLRYLLLQRSA